MTLVPPDNTPELASQGYYNSSKTRWLKTTEMYSLLEAGSMKSKCWQGHVLPEACREDPSLLLPALAALRN
jgi:hypothetical protein